MWKFKPSKYKNAAAKIPKKEEWITEISAGNLSSSCGNHIKASAAYVVFNVDQAAGSSLGVLPIDAKGRYGGSNLPTIQAHSDFVSDFDFSPFDDYLLATCSQDFTAKLWHLPVNPISGAFCSPSCILTQEDKRIDGVSWNPAAENVLALTLGQSVKVFDASKQTALLELSDHEDQVQSLSWKGDGSLMVTSSRDKMIRVFDVRASQKQQVVNGHQNNKDSRVLWLGDRDFILSTGFNTMRQREVVLRDIRNLGQSLKSLALDSSTGIIMPFFDADTSMLFLAGKGDTSIRYLELAEKDPYLVENSVETVEQVKGVALVPKRALDVMKCEVNRLLLLAQQSIIPVSYCVPRKSYRDFQSDLFPDTFSCIPPLNCMQWMNREIKQLTTVSLDPMKKSRLVVRRKFLQEPDEDVLQAEKSSSVAEAEEKKEPNVPLPSTAAASGRKPMVANAGSVFPSPKVKSEEIGHQNAVKPSATPDHEEQKKASQNQGISSENKAAKVLTGVRQSKFRHLQGIPMHRSLNIDNVRNISKSIPGESDFFQANRIFCAVPLSGAGGLIAVIRTDNKGRLSDTSLPALQNGSAVTDFVWDPFNNHRLAVACEDAKIRIWDVPEDGLTETVDEPSAFLRGHTEKIYFVRFHPLAQDVLCSGSYDMTVCLWDLESEEEKIKLIGHTDTIFNIAWSTDGERCATSCKDGKLRIYDPRRSAEPITVGSGLEGSRGGRLVWTCDDRLLVVTGFDKMSVRQVAAFDPTNLSSFLCKIDLDTSPSILVPHYDPDSSTLFLTGRGDSTVRAYEVADDDQPHLFPLSDFKADSLHQALSFLPKSEVDVKAVEFARALRLTSNSIEPVSFKVPRIRTEFFQDDLFPDTRVTWKPTLTSSDWFNGSNKSQQKVSLKPDDMTRLSDAPAEAPKQQKYQSFETYKATYKTDEQKKEELLSAMTNKLCLDKGPLPQDLTEGCDPEEWDDY